MPTWYGRWKPPGSARWWCWTICRTGLEANLQGSAARLVRGTICDPGAVNAAAQGCQSIVHLAALGSVPRSIADPLATHRANVDGTLNVLEAARVESAHVVFASSSSVYGANKTLPKHEGLVAQPMSPYAVSKLSAESYVLAYGRCYGIGVLPFRFFNVFGPLQRADHQYAAVIPRFFDAVMRGDAPIIYGDGRQSRDFTYVGDVAALITEAVLRPVSCDGPVNLAFGRRLELLDVIAEMEAIVGRRITPRFEEPRVGDVLHSQADNTRLTSMFGSFAATPFPDSLRLTHKWFQETSSSEPPPGRFIFGTVDNAGVRFPPAFLLPDSYVEPYEEQLPDHAALADRRTCAPQKWRNLPLG